MIYESKTVLYFLDFVQTEPELIIKTQTDTVKKKKKNNSLVSEHVKDIGHIYNGTE